MRSSDTDDAVKADTAPAKTISISPNSGTADTLITALNETDVAVANADPDDESDAIHITALTSSLSRLLDRLMDDAFLSEFKGEWAITEVDAQRKAATLEPVDVLSSANEEGGEQ